MYHCISYILFIISLAFIPSGPRSCFQQVMGPGNALGQSTEDCLPNGRINRRLLAKQKNQQKICSDLFKFGNIGNGSQLRESTTPVGAKEDQDLVLESILEKQVGVLEICLFETSVV